MDPYKYLFGYVNERFCSKGSVRHFTLNRSRLRFNTYIYSLDSECVSCLADKILEQRKILRSYGVT